MKKETIMLIISILNNWLSITRGKLQIIRHEEQPSLFGFAQGEGREYVTTIMSRDYELTIYHCNEDYGEDGDKLYDQGYFADFPAIHHLDKHVKSALKLLEWTNSKVQPISIKDNKTGQYLRINTAQFLEMN